MIHCVLCQNEKHTDPTTGTLHLKSNLTDVYNVMVRVRRVRVRSLLYALYHYDTLPNITPNLNCSIASTPIARFSSFLRSTTIGRRKRSFLSRSTCPSYRPLLLGVRQFYFEVRHFRKIWHCLLIALITSFPLGNHRFTYNENQHVCNANSTTEAIVHTPSLFYKLT